MKDVVEGALLCGAHSYPTIRRMTGVYFERISQILDEHDSVRELYFENKRAITEVTIKKVRSAQKLVAMGESLIDACLFSGISKYTYHFYCKA